MNHKVLARKLTRPEPAREGEELWLLVPEGTGHQRDEEWQRIARKLGCSAIVEPHEGKSRMHRRAHQAGHDVTRPLVYRHRPPRLGQPIDHEAV